MTNVLCFGLCFMTVVLMFVLLAGMEGGMGGGAANPQMMAMMAMVAHMTPEQRQAMAQQVSPSTVVADHNAANATQCRHWLACGMSPTRPTSSLPLCFFPPSHCRWVCRWSS